MMEPISETKWDLLIDGTNLSASLLALSLSRSDKKILHIDRERNYGGSEAALSLDDAVKWSQRPGTNSVFAEASVTEHEPEKAKLGFSRAYSLALAPQIIYALSPLLPTLVSSKTYRQLEFLAVGNWYIYESGSEPGSGQIAKIPASREDVFADKSIDIKAKRSLIKFLKLVTDPEAQAEIANEIADISLGKFLDEHYGLPKGLQNSLCALTLSPISIYETPASWAIPRITRHLASFGVFGPSFGSVIPKWGGLSEVAQVACRAAAVGGTTYMLGHGIHTYPDDTATKQIEIKLDSEETVRTEWLSDTVTEHHPDRHGYATRSITIVASELRDLFPPIGDGGPPPAATVAVFPPYSVHEFKRHQFPVYLLIHSSDTGECPSGQCLIYSSTAQPSRSSQLQRHPDVKESEIICGHDLLKAAVTLFLSSIGESSEAVLWSLQYTQAGTSALGSKEESRVVDPDTHKVQFPPMSLDLAFDDKVLRDVRNAWIAISGESEGFMTFEDREVGAYDEDERDE